MKRAAQLQPPIERELEVRFRRVGTPDARRLGRVEEILFDILDTADAPEEGRRS